MRNCWLKSKSRLLMGSLCFCCQVCSSVAANDSCGSQDSKGLSVLFIVAEGISISRQDQHGLLQQGTQKPKQQKQKGVNIPVERRNKEEKKGRN